MDNDAAMRMAAFAHIRQLLEVRDALTGRSLGFNLGASVYRRSIRAASGLRKDVATDEVREGEVHPPNGNTRKY
jgi:hypothetical protein